MNKQIQGTVTAVTVVRAFLLILTGALVPWFWAAWAIPDHPVQAVAAVIVIFMLYWPVKLVQNG